MLRRLLALPTYFLRFAFVRFALVGTCVMFVDMAIVQALVMTGTTGPALARVPAFLVAATCAWALNRRFTFHGADRSGPARQWLRYVSANAIGMAVNLTVYYVLIATVDLVWRWPFLGVAAGAIAGLAFNFTASKKLVFVAPKEL
jgi:putative flippase GtrA